MNYLDKVTERSVRDAIIEGFEFLRQRAPSRVTFEYEEAVGQVARILIPAQSAAATKAWRAGQAQAGSGGTNEAVDNRKLLAAFWGFIGSGIIFPRLKEAHAGSGTPLLIDKLTLTERGERVVSQADQHPLHPGFIARFRSASKTASDEVVAHLEDAVSCLEVGLLRPALMMAGLANEETIRVTYEALAYQSKTVPAPPRAKTRDLVGAIASVANAWPGKEERHRLTIATSFVEMVREERNDAAHPGATLVDELHLEGLLAQVAHHLPVFWETIVKPATDAGFVPS